MMNKVIIDECETKLANINGILEIKNTNTHIHLSGINKIAKIIVPEISNITMDLENGTELKLDGDFTPKNDTLKITLNSQNQTTLECRLNIEIIDFFHFDFIHNLLGDDNQSNICIKVASTTGKCKIKTLGTIKKNTKNNNFKEELKGLTIDTANITFLPDLYIESDDVIAVHNATIKCFDKEEIFYLKSKGLEEETSKQIIKNGFLNKQNLGGDKNES